MVNTVILVGNLGKDPEVRFTPNGKAVAKFSVATSEKWTDESGQQQERTDWHNIVVWGKQAEACGQYLNRGRQVFIEGAVRTRSYEKDREKKYITEIVAHDVKFLAGGQGRGRQDEPGPPPGEDDSWTSTPRPHGRERRKTQRSYGRRIYPLHARRVKSTFVDAFDNTVIRWHSCQRRAGRIDHPIRGCDA